MGSTKTPDLTSGPVTGKLIRFAIPIILGNLMQQLYTAADRVVVGQFAENGSAALAAVGSTSSAINLIIGLFIGLATGVNVVCANLLGAKNHTALRKNMHTAVVVAIICGVFLCITGYLMSPIILSWMDTPETVFESSVLYMQLYFLGVPASLLYNFGAGILRSHGDTKRPMYFLIFSGLINVALNMLLVIVFHMDVAGVAIATAVSQYCSAIAVLWLLFSPRGQYRLKLRELRIDKKQLVSIVQVGIPSGLGSIVFSSSNVLLQSTTNSFQSDAILAAKTAALDMNVLIYQIQAALYAGCVSFAGQCYGAGNYKRIEKVAKSALLLCYLFMGVPILLCFIFAPQVISIFNTDPTVIKYGTPLLIICTAGMFLYIPSEIYLGCSRGMRYALSTSLLNMAAICLPRIIWMYAVFPFRRDVIFLYLCYPISWAISSICQFALFKYVYRKAEKRAQQSAMEKA